jgi:RimJ/RimL family protein N-acetyltransferase
VTVSGQVRPPLIRDGRPGDVDAMSWASSDGQRDAWQHQADRAETGEVDFLVAELDGRVLGKAVLDWTHNADGTPWLWMVSVHPDHRGQGIGARLLAVAEVRAQERGHASIEMAVDDDNPRARGLYLRNGYAVVGPHIDEYDVAQPDGRILHVAAPGSLLRKTLTPEVPPLTLTSSLVILAPLALDHVPGLVDAATENRSTFAFTRVPADAPSMAAHVQSLLDEQQTGATIPFAIFDSASGRVLGMTRYLNLDYWNGSRTPSVAEIGSTWLRHSAQGTGANREAKRLMLTHAFDTWGVQRVSFQTDARNEQSRHAIEALGAVFEGIQRAHKPAADGGIRDTAWYSITAADWHVPTKVTGIDFRDACATDFAAILTLYAQLNPEDSPDPTTELRRVYDRIMTIDGLRLFVLEIDGTVIATTYLNIIPNLTRGGSPYALIENVVVAEALRGHGYGKALMAHTLDAAWAAGCYKVMLLTGSKQESTHAFYRACGFSDNDKAAYVARPSASFMGAL